MIKGRTNPRSNEEEIRSKLYSRYLLGVGSQQLFKLI